MSDSDSDSDNDGDYETYYHYTNFDGMKAILKSEKIKQSKNGGKDARYGSGVYLTQLGPDVRQKKIAINNWANLWEKMENDGKTKVAIELLLSTDDVRDVGEHGHNIHLYSGDLDLTEAESIKVHIREPKGGYRTYTVA